MKMSKESRLDAAMPDLEDLAAYIEDRLSADDRARVETRLASDEDYYDVFLETLHFREQEESAEETTDRLTEESGDEEDGEPGKILRPPAWWQKPKIMVPLVAAAALLLVFAQGLRRPGESEDWIASIDSAASLDAGWHEPVWHRTRSVRDTPRDSEGGVAFRLGIRTADLHFALRRDDRTSLVIIARSLAEAAETSGLPFIARRLDALPLEASAQELRLYGHALTDDLVEALRIVPEEIRLFTLGRWAESGRLAVVAGDAEALRKILHTAPDLSREAPGLSDRVHELAGAQEIRLSEAEALLVELIRDLAG